MDSKGFALTLSGLRWRRVALVVLCTVLFVWLSVSWGNAQALIYVNSFEDAKSTNDGQCTLREAIIAANTDRPSGNRNDECIAGSGADTIVLPAGTYVLTRTDNGKEDSSSTGDLDILDDLTIVGDGADVTIIDGGVINDRILHVINGTVEVSGVTIRSGNVPRADGGGILNAADLTLDRVIVAENRADLAGGGIASSGRLTITKSAIISNTATTSGGSLLVDGGSAEITNVTISGGNAAEAGAIAVIGGSTFLNNVTVALSQSGTSNVSVQLPGVLDATNTIIAGACAGCTIAPAHNVIGVDPLLAPLADNGGPTPTHALTNGSPAIEGGDNNTCAPTDQRGVNRPIGQYCDIGAYEYEDPPQTESTVFVNTALDVDDGFCTFLHCSLREAINAANDSPTIDTIKFDIAADPTIFVQSPLPSITEPVTIVGLNRDMAYPGQVTLDGSQAGTEADGLEITSGHTTIKSLIIENFDGNGVVITTNGMNTIEGNTIRYNGGDGIQIIGSQNNVLRANSIHDNGEEAIDLEGDGRSNNDNDDDDIGANFIQNYPVLLSAVPHPGVTMTPTMTVTGYLNSQPSQTFEIEVFGSATCAGFPSPDPTQPNSQYSLGSGSALTDVDGNDYFTLAGLDYPAGVFFVTATATDSAGNTSEVSDCISVGPNNTSWPNALDLAVAGDLTPALVDQYLDRFGQSRWYRFPVIPNSKVFVTLSNLPADYDLTVYKDIRAAYDAFQSPTPDDLPQLGAEFAPEAFSPEAFSPEAFSPEAFSPEAFSPEAFSPINFSPEAFSPEAFSPEAFSPEAFSPEAFSPEAFSPEAFSPEAFSPEAFSPEAFSPEAFSPEAFSGAQLRALLGVSAFRGTSSEGLIINTWNNAGYMYVRVRGANGASDAQLPFHVEVSMLSNVCDGVQPLTAASNTTPVAGSFKTIILTDFDRMAGSAAEKAALFARLNAFAGRPEIKGVVVELGQDDRVLAANAQADDPLLLACPYAKNLVAGAVEDIVDAFWDLNPLEYVLIVGDDSVVPFFRIPDIAMLANESNYRVPVKDNSASQASIRNGYVLGQDNYGTRNEVSFKSSSIPIPVLGIGRLVETLAEVDGMLDAYDLTASGIVSPTTAAVTGYDFLTDSALGVESEFLAGLPVGAQVDTLIDPLGQAPASPLSWTADDLRALLLTERHDLTYLAGHFSASGALAADYVTRMTAAELASSATADMVNAVVFSAGCHSAYNIVTADGIMGVTEEPDWAQAFARQGATLIGGTGYQYGDTDYLEYSERLYLLFAQRLRTGTGPVSIGHALAEAKRQYLLSTPRMRGIHQKALVESTIFGFPMLRIDMLGQRIAPPPDQSDIPSLSPVGIDPGQTLGLYSTTLQIPIVTEEQVKLLKNVQDNTLVSASYLSGTHGIVTNPAEPVLPLQLLNATAPNDEGTLRGIGFRTGTYVDLPNRLAFTGAPTTEIRGVHAPFLVDFFYPVQIWRTNYFDAVGNPNGITNLALMPAQFKSSSPGSPTGTWRKYTDLGLRLYYSGNTDTFTDTNGVPSTPALSAPPYIVSVAADPVGNMVNFEAIVLGNPAAGIQEVWVTYTGAGGPLAGQWQSLDLKQSKIDPTRWSGSLDLSVSGATAGEVRYLVQAVNGVGLVSMHANLGAGNRVVPGGLVQEPTSISLQVSGPASAAYGTKATFSATLFKNGVPVEGAPITFRLGLQSRVGISDAAGNATVTFTLLGLPANYQLVASFAGTSTLQPSSASEMFTITPQGTNVSLMQPAQGFFDDDALLTALLTDVDGRRLIEKSVRFELSSNGNVALVRWAITDYLGRAIIGDLPLSPGDYDVLAEFDGTEDGRYSSSAGAGTLTILNSVPVAADDAYVVDEDQILTVAAPGVLANDLDGNGSPLTAVLLTGPSFGSLTLNADGAFIYIPDPDFSGLDSFTYAASDGSDNSNAALVTITVNPVNDAPMASDDAYSVDENQVLNVPVPGVLANDNDIDSSALTAVLDAGPTNGSLVLNPDGSFTYTPEPGYFGADSFTYHANDGAADSNVATVILTINMDNAAPDCSASYLMPKHIWPLDKDEIVVTVNGIIDDDNDPVTITILSIFQDEVVGVGPNSPDGGILGPGRLWVRAERDGGGDGRVYHIKFVASDGYDSCTRTLKLPTVAHDQSPESTDAIDGGPLYDSTVRMKEPK